MASQRDDEERHNFEKFSFPRWDNVQRAAPDYLEKCCVEPLISRRHQLYRNQQTNNGPFFQELSQCKMISTPNHRHNRHRRHQFRGLHRNATSSNEKACERKRVSAIRQWSLESGMCDEYVYHSPKETIQHFNEQVEMNSKGHYESLTEFARDNKLDVRGKIFAICEEPKIDLEQGLEEALTSTRIE